MPVELPRYLHDCDNCIFLGQYKEYDLYICSSFHATLIARWASNGSCYLSAEVGSFSTSDAIIEGERRAVEDGIIKMSEILPLQHSEKASKLPGVPKEVSDALLNCKGYLDSPIMRKKFMHDDFYKEVIDSLRAAVKILKLEE